MMSYGGWWHLLLLLLLLIVDRSQRRQSQLCLVDYYTQYTYIGLYSPIENYNERVFNVLVKTLNLCVSFGGKSKSTPGHDINCQSLSFKNEKQEQNLNEKERRKKKNKVKFALKHFKCKWKGQK